MFFVVESMRMLVSTPEEANIKNPDCIIRNADAWQPDKRHPHPEL